MTTPIHPKTHVGHIHLKVADLERAIHFYRDILGFELLLTRASAIPPRFFSAGGYHHHIGLNTWHSKNAGPAPERAAGLYHFAIFIHHCAAG